jgi:hypothetical protein
MSTSAIDEAPKGEWMKASEWLRRHPGIFGKDTFYARLKDGSVPCLKVGRTVLVPDDLLDRMMAGVGERNG